MQTLRNSLSRSLVATAEAVLSLLQVEKFHLVGHCMGGLTALELAHKHPKRVRSFVNISGNLAPEDCVLSREVVGKAAALDDEAEFEGFIKRMPQTPSYGGALYALSLRSKLQPSTIQPMLSSTVGRSEKGELLRKFLALRFARTLMHGDQCNKLSYLPALKAAGVWMSEIMECEHFPMYSNAPSMWAGVEIGLSLGERFG